jgi:hypothetical protein
MKRVILFIWIFIFIGCSSKKQAANPSEEEKKNPKSYLSVKAHDRHNLIGQTVIIGDISNNAGSTSYKDVDLQLLFYSKTGTLLEKDRETIYEVLTPGGSKHFKTKYFAPKGTDSIGFAILGAKVLEK